MSKAKKNDQNTTFLELKNTVEEFCQQRDWQNNDPKQLLLSAFIELAELTEYYQWSKEGHWQKDKQKEIAFELVDIFFYLLRFINKSEIDFSQSFFDKVDKLAIKYPAGKRDQEFYNQIKASYRKSGKNKLYD